MTTVRGVATGAGISPLRAFIKVRFSLSEIDSIRSLLTSVCFSNNTTNVKPIITFTVPVDGKKVQLSGLLVDFINNKAASFVEPSRKGTARGEPIGMKQKKYLATLFALTSLRVKDQATELKIPEKLLGKWRTEKPFESRVIDHIREFDLIFCNHVKQHEEKDLKMLEASWDLPITEYAKFHSKFRKAEPDKQFDDRTIYGKFLINCLGDSVGEVIEMKKQPELFLLTLRAIDFLRRDFRGLPPDTARDEVRRQKYQPQIIDTIKSILVKDEITERDRKRGIYLLELLRPE
jgi:hypothetical protein